jgi:hypothetical protein
MAQNLYGTLTPGINLYSIVDTFPGMNPPGIRPSPVTNTFPGLNPNMGVLMALNPQTRGNIPNLINQATATRQQFPQLFSSGNLFRFPALAALNALANPATARMYF